MRKIKFRAWDTKHNEMIEDFLSMGEEWSVTDHETNTSNEDLIPLQFIGLKDKNGVEIFEGDVLAQRPYRYFKSNGDRDRRVRQDWCRKTLVEYQQFEDEDTYGIGFVWDGIYLRSQDYEVIGNIYENPELLEAKS